jgi:glutathione S-transferase
MHSGFARLRDEFGMNVRLRSAQSPSVAVAAEISRIVELWREGRERFGRDGDFLCGAFTAVDAFWCPVAFRFQSYGVALDGTAAAYCRALLALPAMRQWAADAASETERIPGLEQGLQAQQQ